MRTRLDEIVECAMNNPRVTGAQQLLSLQCAVQEAFRHGVEQCYGRDSDPYYLTVQPAPAEEKEVFHRTDKYQHVGTGTCCDRRKGERRNPLLPRISFLIVGNSSERIYMLSEVAGWRHDLRSGKDRRK